MARTEDKAYRYDSTSQDGQRLTPDEGGADWKLPFDEGAVSTDHINARQYQSPKRGAGFDYPKDNSGSRRGQFGAPDSHYGRDHLDSGSTPTVWPTPVRYQPSKYSNPSARADKSSDTRATAARSRASCSDECLTNDDGDDGHWYGAPNSRK